MSEDPIQKAIDGYRVFWRDQPWYDGPDKAQEAYDRLLMSKMTDEEMDNAIAEIGQLCLDAIEKDLGEPLNVLKLKINGVEYDEETGTIIIDYDYGELDG